MFPDSCRFCSIPLLNGGRYPHLPPVWLAASILLIVPYQIDDVLAARRCVSSPMMTKEHQV